MQTALPVDADIGIGGESAMNSGRRSRHHPRDRSPAATWEPFRDDAVRDAQLLVRGSAGDAVAFEELYDRHSSYVFGLALRITNDRPTAEEVVQDAFVSLWRTASSFDPDRASLRTWVMAITHHRAIDAVRRRRAATTPLETVTGAPILEERLWTPDIWPEVSARLDHMSVRLAMASIPAVQRVALELAYFGGFTQTEMAAQLGVPLGTVKSQVRLGLARLRVLLTDGFRAVEPN